MSDNKLHFFCGKMAAGKSTLAASLQLESKVLISEDSWLEQLYAEQIHDLAGYVHYSGLLRNALFEHICDLLRQGMNVVLDFPANTQQQRQWFKSIVERSQVQHVLHYLDLSDEQCKQQLKQRNRQQGKSAEDPFASQAMFEQVTAYFQPPQVGEGFNIVTYGS